METFHRKSFARDSYQGSLREQLWDLWDQGGLWMTQWVKFHGKSRRIQFETEPIHSHQMDASANHLTLHNARKSFGNSRWIRHLYESLWSSDSGVTSHQRMPIMRSPISGRLPLEVPLWNCEQENPHLKFSMLNLPMQWVHLSTNPFDFGADELQANCRWVANLPIAFD